MSRDEIERWLRADLQKAQDDFRKATSTEKPAASERLRQALEVFTAFILRGELPRAGSDGSYEHKRAG